MNTPAQQFRVTKYDPAFRIDEGSYTRQEWTSFSDVGLRVGTEVLTAQEYGRVEDAYVAAATAFLEESGITTIVVKRVECSTPRSIFPTEDTVLNLSAFGRALRWVLREEFWCTFETENAFVHIGYDYYMYIGVPAPCPNAWKKAEELGLFPEDFPSPYLELFSSENSITPTAPSSTVPNPPERSTTIASLVQQLSSFDEQEMEVRIQLEDLRTVALVSVGRAINPRKERGFDWCCVLGAGTEKLPVP